MTAQRWWVRAFARWQARIDSVKGQIQAVSLAVTAYSTFSLLLQSVGLGKWVPVLGGVLLIAGPGYAYMFFEGGVWNQVSRDRADMSGNYAGPNARIKAEHMVRGLSARDKGDVLDEDERDIIRAELDATFDELRDGVDLEAAD